MTFIYVEREYDTYIFLCELNPKSFRIFPSYIRRNEYKKKEYFWHPNTEWSTSAKTQASA